MAKQKFFIGDKVIISHLDEPSGLSPIIRMCYEQKKPLYVRHVGDLDDEYPYGLYHLEDENVSLVVLTFFNANELSLYKENPHESFIKGLY